MKFGIIMNSILMLFSLATSLDFVWAGGFTQVRPSRPIPSIPKPPPPPRSQVRPNKPLPQVPSKIKLARKENVKKLNAAAPALSQYQKQLVQSRDPLRAQPPQAETSRLKAGVNGFVQNSPSFRMPSKVVDATKATVGVVSERGIVKTIKAPVNTVSQVHTQTKQAGANRDLHNEARSLYHARNESKQAAQEALKKNNREEAMLQYYQARRAHKALVAPTTQMTENLYDRMKSKSTVEKQMKAAGEVRTLSDTARDKSDLRKLKQEINAQYGAGSTKQWKDAGNGTEREISLMQHNQNGRTASDVGRAAVDTGVGVGIAAGTVGVGGAVSVPSIALTSASVAGKAANGQVRVNQTAEVMRDKSLNEDQKQEKIAQINAQTEKRDHAISATTSLGNVVTNVTDLPSGVVNTIHATKDFAGDIKSTVFDTRRALQRTPTQGAGSKPQAPSATAP